MNEWAESRLKSILKEPLLYGLNESAEEDRTDWPRYIRITDFDDFNNLSDDTFRSLSPLKAKDAWLKNGDILFARSGATAGKTYLYSSLPNGACYAGYLIRARLSQKKVFPNFLSYFTKSFVYENWKNRVNIQTTIQNISAEKYYQMPFRYPDLDTQRRIVTYLDSHVTSIDKRVSLLTTKRDHYLRLKTAIINRAVTQGLNPEVKMKDSGIEWIGMIPEQWNISRVKTDFSLHGRIGWNGLRSEEFDTFSYAYLVTGQDFNSKQIDWSKCYQINEERFREDPYIQIDNGDILITKDGTIGKIAIVDNLDKPACLNSGIFLMRSLHHFKYSQQYMYWLLNSSIMKTYIKITQIGSTIAHLYQNVFERMIIVCPPFSEQQAIASYLDEKCTKIDAIVENLNQQIEKHKLLKRALINEVITGQRAV